jgi:hypothetical protein
VYSRVLIHAHIKCTLLPAEREAAVGVVEVVERHAKVGKYAVNTVNVVISHEIHEISEV